VSCRKINTHKKDNQTIQETLYINKHVIVNYGLSELLNTLKKIQISAQLSAIMCKTEEEKFLQISTWNYCRRHRHHLLTRVPLSCFPTCPTLIHCMPYNALTMNNTNEYRLLG